MVKFKYFKTLAVYNNNASTIANDDIVFIEDDNSLVTHGKTYKFADLEPEYEYVDLGLPSGTLWAKYNVGATSETEYGNYYMYGKGARRYNSSDSAYTGNEDPLSSVVDTAVRVWGGSWHMPTRAQMQELIDNTTYQWVTDYEDGINGGIFTAANGNYVFFPAAGWWMNGSQSGVGTNGYYWTSSPYSSNTGYNLSVGDDYTNTAGSYRNSGFLVRPVKEKNVGGAGTNGYIAKWTGTNSIGNLIALSSSISTQTQSTKFLREDGTWAVPSYSVPKTPVVVSSVSAGTSVSVTIDPNKTYSFPQVSSLTITLGTLVDSSNYINEYHFEFNSGSTATTLSLPNTVKGIDATSIEANKHYEVSIKYDPKDTNYYGIIYSWALS